MSFLQGLSLTSRLINGAAFPRVPRARAFNPLWNHYRCGDDQWIALGMLQPDRYREDFSRAIGRPDFLTDERFQTMGVRARNAEACIQILDTVFASKPCAEWLDILRKGGDFIFTVVNSLNDLPNDPQMLANDYIVEFDHPAFGATQYVGIPVRLSETPGSIRAPAPEHGQHTELLLTELLGYSWDEVASLRERRVI
jgi:crotonobetainyl-CoA:carnitine CoA-transferase CaiB-like acyl-CoA transferase